MTNAGCEGRLETATGFRKTPDAIWQIHQELQSTSSDQRTPLRNGDRYDDSVVLTACQAVACGAVLNFLQSQSAERG